MNKRGETFTLEALIFIILNLIFFFGFWYFIYSSGNSALAYEQQYAKHIALAIDMAKPGTIVTLDLSEIESIVKANKLDLSKVFSVDNTNKNVIVNLARVGGYRFSYFSDYNVKFSIENNKLKIMVGNN